MVKGRRIHTAKFRRCVKKVKKQRPKVRSPYAVCTKALGKKAFLKKRRKRK